MKPEFWYTIKDSGVQCMNTYCTYVRTHAFISGRYASHMHACIYVWYKHMSFPIEV